MSTISDYVSGDHKSCDGIFAGAEESAAGGDWPQAESEFARFRRTMERHFAMEEYILFPAFEDETGMHGTGPTEIMRSEHAQIRSLIDEMKGAVAARDKEQYLGLSETLLVLMQQHNLKEEGMLYPMMDQVLGSQAADLIGRCNALEVTAA